MTSHLRGRLEGLGDLFWLRPALLVLLGLLLGQRWSGLSMQASPRAGSAVAGSMLATSPLLAIKSGGQFLRPIAGMPNSSVVSSFMVGVAWPEGAADWSRHLNP